jgi:ubiquinone/menaquinone biosynthesis C-methylase UbiE
MNERTFRSSAAHKLEDPDRQKWLPAEDVLAALDLRAGMCVADIGAGTGYFTLPAARAVGPQGRVFAVDLQPEMLAKVREKLAGLSHVELVEGTAHKTNLAGASCDRVLVANTWHELDDHPAALDEMKRLLREEGRLAILDWRTDVDRPPGPPLEHRWALERTVQTLERSGWSIESFSHIGDYSYIILASVADESVQS